MVLKSLKDADILAFLEQPKSLDSIVEKFSWDYPSKYVDDVIQVLLDDNVLKLVNGNLYKLNIDISLVEPKVNHIEDFNTVFAEYSEGIPTRLQGKSIDYSGRLALFNWDSVLAGKIYQALRDSAFNFINKGKLKNSHLLDLGCGAGYETADIWLRLRKKGVKITAVDNDSDLLRIAREEFCFQIAKRGLKNMTWEKLDNPPNFVLGGAEKLNFEDNYFDAIYFSNFLHWLEDPLVGVKEIVRVLKPEGIVFGGQGTTEITNPYLDITARVVKGTNGYFSKQQFLNWFKEAGISDMKTTTMVNTFKGKKPLL